MTIVAQQQPPGASRPQRAPVPRPFDRLLTRRQMIDAYGPLSDDFAACLALVDDLAPADAEAALTSRMATYLDVLADALGAAVPVAAGRTA